MLNDLITYVSIGCALWMAWRYLRRSIRAMWDMLVSSIWGNAPMRSVELLPQTSRQTTQTDQQATRPSVIPPKPPRFALDRTRQAVLDELLTHGWTITDLRRENILRGDNVTISQEVAETRKRLGLADPDRTIKVRDEKGERVIPV